MCRNSCAGQFEMKAKHFLIHFSSFYFIFCYYYCYYFLVERRDNGDDAHAVFNVTIRIDQRNEKEKKIAKRKQKWFSSVLQVATIEFVCSRLTSANK